jgi:hypothetical protein
MVPSCKRLSLSDSEFHTCTYLCSTLTNLCTREPIYAELHPGNAAAGHARGYLYTILSPGQARLQWTPLLPTPATPQVFPIMPIISKMQQQQQPARKKCNAFQQYRVGPLTSFRFCPGEIWLTDKQAMKYIRHIGFAAVSTGAVSYCSFVASMHNK